MVAVDSVIRLVGPNVTAHKLVAWQLGTNPLKIGKGTYDDKSGRKADCNFYLYIVKLILVQKYTSSHSVRHTEQRA